MARLSNWSALERAESPTQGRQDGRWPPSLEESNVSQMADPDQRLVRRDQLRMELRQGRAALNAESPGSYRRYACLGPVDRHRRWI